MFNESLHHKLDHIMATLTELTAAITRINTALANVGTEINTLNSTIASAISSTDSDNLLTQLNTIATGTESLVPIPVIPTT